jgi:dihydroxyacid dehydratase/phosphogluconate dehydratase
MGIFRTDCFYEIQTPQSELVRQNRQRRIHLPRWMKNQGIPDQEFRGKPVIGICNTWSELTPCNAHFRELAEVVKRGVSEARGFPVEFPVMSLGEALIKPAAMLYRNPRQHGCRRVHPRQSG